MHSWKMGMRSERESHRFKETGKKMENKGRNSRDPLYCMGIPCEIPTFSVASKEHPDITSPLIPFIPPFRNVPSLSGIPKFPVPFPLFMIWWRKCIKSKSLSHSAAVFMRISSSMDWMGEKKKREHNRVRRRDKQGGLWTSRKEVKVLTFPMRKYMLAEFFMAVED